MDRMHLGLLLVLFVLQLPWLAAAQSEASPEFTTAYQAFEAALKTNDLEATINRCTEAQAIALQQLGDGDRRTADLSYYCGALFNRAGRRPSAIAMLKQAIAQHEKAYGAEAVELIRVLMAFGATRETDWPEREQALRRALEIQKRHQPDDRLGFADLAVKVASEFIAVKMARDEVRDLLGDALEMVEKAYGKNAPQLVPVLLALGDAETGYFIRSSGVNRNYQRALKITRDDPASDPTRHADLALEIGDRLLRSSMSKSAAKPLIDEALATYRERLGASHPKTGMALLEEGAYRFFKKESLEEIETPLNAALAIFSSDGNYRNHEIRVRSELVRLYTLNGASDRATEHLLAIGKISPAKDQEPRPIYTISPRYPAAAEAAGKDGWVRVGFTIDATGKVQDAVVLEFAGHSDLRQAALDAINQWRYFPRFVDGQPTSSPGMQVRLSFDVR